jgi:predicted dehydrogenase
MIPGADARKAVALVLAVYEAARTGRTVRLV